MGPPVWPSDPMRYEPSVLLCPSGNTGRGLEPGHGALSIEGLSTGARHCGHLLVDSEFSWQLQIFTPQLLNIDIFERQHGDRTNETI